MRPHASSDRSSLIWIAVLVGAPLLWLTMLQTGYLLSHWACGTGNKLPVQLTTFIAVVIFGALFAAIPKRIGDTNTPPTFLASMALWFSAGFLLVAIASAIAPLIIDPCG